MTKDITMNIKLDLEVVDRELITSNDIVVNHEEYGVDLEVGKAIIVKVSVLNKIKLKGE